VNSGPETRDIVRKAYEFALNHVGQDKDSGDIWMDYIQFLKSGEVCSASSDMITGPAVMFFLTGINPIVSCSTEAHRSRVMCACACDGPVPFASAPSACVTDA